MSKKIGIIGAGTAGLHLGLYLRQHGVDVTLHTDRKPDEYHGMRLLNTVAHHAVTVKRETALGVNHWPDQKFGYFGHHYFINLQPQPLQFYGDLHAPSRAVDYRIYQPRLMEDFMNAGGNIEYREIKSDEISSLSARYDLLVICTGKGPFGQMFTYEPQHSPFDKPQRALCVGIFKGIKQRPVRAVTMYFSPGAGEMIEIPTTTFNGMQNALVIENIPGGDLEVLAKTKYDDNPKAFMALLLDKLRKHYPTCAERIDEQEFDLANGPLDLLQGGVTPTVRRSHVALEGGKMAIALGDVQVTVDPLLGQGANVASHAAWILGEEIVRQDVFDERFVEHVNMRRNDRVLGAARWTNFMMTNLKAMPVELQQFIGALSQNRALADEFTDNFNFPEKQWDCFASVDRMKAWVETRMAVATKRPKMATAA
ncbi:styrene monooxygenase subunit StyA [Nevskia ramosa]|uniref:styrene monooxygenase subunit StyA n=1 Tax=Nevskia ramosa TaxID=64002 RepID=UPI0003B2EEE4|nr:styrene monooxygenase/indole monooxygenase family protein [Nevskia ramosa]